jgi:hypothetical protein
MASDSAAEQNVERPLLDQSEQFRRKLWFDYLSKINDRELHQNHLSGVSDWVLMGLLGAILYRGIPALPSLLKIPGLASSVTVTLTLLANSLVLLLFAVASLLLAEEPGEQPRVLPRSKRGLGLTPLLALAGLATLSLWLSRTPGQPSYVHYAAVAGGVLWTVAFLVMLMGASLRRSYQRLSGAEFPIYSTVKPTASLGGIAALLVLWFLALASCYAFLRYIWLLQTVDRDWVTPLSAAAEILLAIGILLTLYSRSASSSTRARYLELERDIILEGLSSDDIAERFTGELVGSSISEWITSTRDKFRRCNERVTSLNSTLQTSLVDMDAIPVDFHRERKARAEESLRDAFRVLKEVEKALIAVHIQLPGPSSLPADLTQATKMMPVVRDFKSRIGEFKRDIAATIPLCEKLEHHAGVKESDARRLIIKMTREAESKSSKDRAPDLALPQHADAPPPEGTGSANVNQTPRRL